VAHAERIAPPRTRPRVRCRRDACVRRSAWHERRPLQRRGWDLLPLVALERRSDVRWRFQREVLFAIIVSEIRVEGLVRSVMRRPRQQFAGRSRCSDAASRGGTSDLTTAVRAVAKSKVGAVPGQGDSLERIGDLIGVALKHRPLEATLLAGVNEQRDGLVWCVRLFRASLPNVRRRGAARA